MYHELKLSSGTLMDIFKCLDTLTVNIFFPALEAFEKTLLIGIRSEKGKKITF